MKPRRPDRSIRVSAGDGCMSGHFGAMGSPCEVLVESGDREQTRHVTEQVAAEAWRIEDKFSRYLRGNVVWRINQAAGRPVQVDEETAHLIDFANLLFDLSGGAFDITSGVLRRVWTFDGSANVPSRKAVKRVLKLVGWKKVRWQSPVLTLRPEMEIDLGGIGKEYAVDRCAAVARQSVDLACLVNFGGDLAVSRARQDGWRVGVESGTQRIRLTTGALATSGDARRYLLKDGVRYSHIVDPATGWPVPDAPHSVTVAADTCTQAGMLSTLAMLKGAQAEAFLDAEGAQFWCNRGAPEPAGTRPARPHSTP